MLTAHKKLIRRAEALAQAHPGTSVTLYDIRPGAVSEKYTSAYPSGLVREFPNESRVAVHLLAF